MEKIMAALAVEKLIELGWASKMCPGSDFSTQMLCIVSQIRIIYAVVRAGTPQCPEWVWLLVIYQALCLPTSVRYKPFLCWAQTLAEWEFPVCVGICKGMVLVTINKSVYLAGSTGGFCEDVDVTLLNTVRESTLFLLLLGGWQCEDW